MSDAARHGWPLGRIGLWLAMLVAFAVIATVAFRGRSDPPQASLAPTDPFAALEARTHDNPEDGEAWRELAARHFDDGRFEQAASAYDSAVKLAPDRAALWSARGEARVMASRTDPMPPAAVFDFETAIRLDPTDPRARYFLGVKQDLGGDHAGAIDAWLALLADTPPGAVWEADLRRTIEQVGKINRIEVASRLSGVKQPRATAPPAMAGIPGPSAADLGSASAIPPSQQREMAEGMTARLEARLKADPANPDGWLMLIRSRKTLGQDDKARAALAAAVAANPGKAAELREQAALLGVR